MSVFEKMSEDEIQAAQEKLNKLCKEHRVKEFNIQQGDGLVCWRKLVQSMCGIDVNYCEKPGKKAYSNNFILDVGARIDAYRSFERFDQSILDKDNNLVKIGDPMMSKIAIPEVKDQINFEMGTDYSDGQISGIYQMYKKLRKAEVKGQENDPTDPDKFYQNLK